jgi:predicted RNA-binding Zn-ribbon protein involved in translation (DUF1610 family)
VIDMYVCTPAGVQYAREDECRRLPPYYRCEYTTYT